jgi:hypothetical protein
MEILRHNHNNHNEYENDNYRIILNEDDEHQMIMNAINNNYSPLRLYRSLNFMEEKEAFEYMKNQESSLLILYTLRSNHRYYFIKIGEKILQIITNNDYELYAIRNMTNELEGL